MRAICVCVDYSDILAITLPHNRHHFTDVMIITTSRDKDTYSVAVKNGCTLYVTDDFYADGAYFNKWRCLEQGLEAFGREDGWLCIMDADILWPEIVDCYFEEGNIYVPRRHMHEDTTKPIPLQHEWLDCEYHLCDEWLGYSQIFHCADPVLEDKPWFPSTIPHAAIADMQFVERWSEEKRLRPRFEVLHVGESHRNWCGRTTPFVNGAVAAEAEVRRKNYQTYFTDIGELK